MILALVAALAPALAAPEAPRAWPIVLELPDPGGLLAAAPVVAVTGSDGQPRDMLLRDDGEAPDAKPGDRVYTHPLPRLPAGRVAVRVRAGTSAWAGETTLAEGGGGTLVVRLAADGTATVTTSTESTVTDAFDVGSPARTVEELRGGFLLWLVVLAGVGFGAGSVLMERRGKGPVPARLAVPEGPRVAPVRLEAEEVGAALATLDGHRVVCAGPLDGAPAHVVPCVEAGVLPAELVAAVEALAARPGPPVALLVTDLAALDAPGNAPAAEALAAAVAGRFPLHVVGGPSGWARPG